MATLNLQCIDDDVYERLRVRAAGNGVSVEEEVRRILRSAMTVPERLGQFALECFGEEHGVELELSPREPLERGR